MTGELGPDEITGLGEDAARRQLKQEYGDAIVFRAAETIELTSRRLDPAPQIGGAGYNRWNSAHTSEIGACSTAFPVTYNGTRYMLTAGHCLPATETTYNYGWAEQTSGTSVTYYFGKKWASSWKSSQDRVGDFAMLKGSTYKARVYVSDTTAVDVAQVDWGTPSANEQVCRSGRTTGTKCRLFITDPDWEGWIGTTFDSIGGTQPKVWVRGLDGCADQPGYYTRLSGPKAAYPTMTMPVLP